MDAYGLHEVVSATSVDDGVVAFSIYSIREPEVTSEVHILRVDAELTRVCDHQTISCTDGFCAHALAIDRGRLFVAGGGSGSQLSFLDLSSSQLSWTPIELPFKEWEFRKAIDELLVDQNRLIAVDNVVWPKYLVECDISETPIAKCLKPLPYHGTYESIASASICKNWIAILSFTSGECGPDNHIALYARKSLNEQASLHSVPSDYRDSLQHDAEMADDEIRSYFVDDAPEDAVEWWRKSKIEELNRLAGSHIADWSALAFCGEKLIVAARERGVAVLDMSDKLPVNSRTSRSNRFSERCQNAISYLPCDLGDVEFVDSVDENTALITYATEFVSAEGYPFAGLPTWRTAGLKSMLISIDQP